MEDSSCSESEKKELVWDIYPVTKLLFFKTRSSFVVRTKTALNQLLLQNLYKLIMFKY